MSDPAAEARAEAEDILSEPPFAEEPAERIEVDDSSDSDSESLGEWLDALFPDISGEPSIGWLFYLALAVALIALAVWLGRRAAERSVTEPRERGRRSRSAASEPDADDLERAAERADQEGDDALALRLRFEAALFRLRDAGLIELRPSLTARAAARTLGSSGFEEMARTFEAVVYGEREPTESESRAARERWPEVVGELAAR